MSVGVFRPLLRTGLVAVDAFGHYHHRDHRDPSDEEFAAPQIILTTQGEWRIASSRGGGIASPATVVAGEAGLAYRCAHDERRPRDRTLSIVFAGEVAERWDDRPLFPRTLVSHSRRSHELGRALREELASSRAGRALAAEALAVELLVEVARNGRTARPGSLTHAAALDRARAYIDEHHAEEITLARLAEVAHLSPWHFARLFRERFETTPRRYLVRARVDRAATLLRTTSLPVAAVAAAVGFASSSHFAATFRREVGCTPARYRSRS